jgi:hypothetical protein
LLASLPGTTQVVTEGDSLPQFDCYTPVMSLPLALGTHLDSVPAPIPYLQADADRIAQWSQRLGTPAPGGPRRLRVGLAWSGNAAQPNDYNRSMPLRQLRPLTQLDAEFISLQPQVRAADAPELALQGIRFFGAALADFADTAALAAQMDLVISVCTSTAHLAGALGLPLWVLLCHAADWRWLTDRSDSPWYPGARLFRQTAAHDWDGVIQEVRAQLQAQLALHG